MKRFIVMLVVLLFAVIISWFTPFLFLDSPNEHYPNCGTSVRITSTGEKYHLSSCQYLRRSSIKITLEKAVARGYDSCSKCDPPEFVSVESYQVAKDQQPLVLLIIVIPLLSVLIALLSLFIVEKVLDLLSNVFYVLDDLPDKFFIFVMIAIYITTVIQGFRMMIIW